MRCTAGVRDREQRSAQRVRPRARAPLRLRATSVQQHEDRQHCGAGSRLRRSVSRVCVIFSHFILSQGGI